VGVAVPLQNTVKDMKAINNIPKSALSGFVVIDFLIFHQLPMAYPDIAQ
jgi:hypothetical protein